MEKIDLTQQFAVRLRHAMIEAGFSSARSASGVCIHKLVEITGHSMQICRKYLRGEAIPEPMKLWQIALKLQVSAGWLLFGEGQGSIPSAEHITISKNLLHYIFNKITPLYNSPRFGDEIADFMLNLLENIAQINANEDQLKKVIDLVFASARTLRF